MRILHLVHQYPPEHIGGVELYTQSLAQMQARAGHDVAILTRSDRSGAGWESRQEGGVTIFAAWHGEKSPSERFRTTFAEPTLRNLAREVIAHFRPTWVHVQHLMGWDWGVLDDLRVQHIPYLVTLHDYWWVCGNANLLTNYSGERCDGPRLYLNCARCVAARSGSSLATLAIPAFAPLMGVRALRLRHALMQAKALIAPSSFVRAWYGSHGIPASRISVVPFGLPNLPSLQRSQPLSPTRRFLYAGGIAATKGVHIALEAFQQTQGDAQLLIAGDLTVDPAYTRKLQAQVTDRVRLLGKLSRPDLLKWMAEVDALLVPSRWPETFCFVAREALAVATPVLASRLGALSETIRHEVDGLLLPPDDVEAWRAAMQRLLDQPTLLETMRRAIQPQADEQTHLAQLMNLYD